MMKRHIWVWIFVLLAAALNGCASSTGPTTPTFSPPRQNIATPTKKATVSPTATATPEPWATLYLWLHPQTDPTLVETAQRLLGTGFRVVQGTEPPRDVPDLAQVWALPPWTPESLAPLAREVPTVPIVVMGKWQEGLPDNLRVMDTTYVEHPYRAFLAGYMSVLLSPNWRGVLLMPAGEDARQMAGAFRQGGRYYCGLCRPPRPPVLGYPLVFQVPDPQAPASWDAACRRALQEWKAETVYLVHAPSSAASCFRQSQTLVLWDGPLPQGAEADIVVRAPTWEEAVQETRQTLETQAASRVPLTQIHIQDRTNVLSPGKLHLILRVQEGLVQGLIEIPSAP